MKNFTSLSLLKKQIKSYVFLIVLISGAVFAQPTVLYTGLTSTTPAPSSSRFTLNDMGVFRQYRFQSNQNASVSTVGWAFHTGTTGSPSYNPCWRPFTGGNTLGVNGFIPTSYANGARYNTSGGGSDGLLPAITSGNYYTFNVMENSTASNDMALLETNYNPVNLVSVSHTTPGSANGVGKITVTTSATPSSGEYVYVRYSGNGWTTSDFILLSFSGTTGTAYLPCFAGGSTVSYYIFSSNKTKSEITADVTTFGTQNVYDMYTLNLLNNSGANYNYTQPSNTTFAGNYQIPSSCFPTLASFVTAINAGSIVGAVTVNIDAGYTETAPAGGYNLTATGTASNTITFIKNGSGTNPTFTASAAHTSGIISDAVFKIVGGDYITIDGLTFIENASNTTTTSASNNMTEFGVALFYATTTNGCQNITIKNCTIDLNRTYQNTFGIYANATHTATNMTTSATGGANGGNSNLTITGNTITDVNQGIVVVGPTAAANHNDTLVIGGSLSNANTITNYGTTGTFSGYANVTGTVNGIVVRNTKNYTISYNTITSSNGGVTTTGNVRGIYIDTFNNAPTGTLVNSINNNSISVKGGNAGNTISGIMLSDNTSGNTTTTLSINNNDFNGFGHTVSGTGDIRCIYNPATVGTLNINSNTFTNLSVNTTGTVYLIYNSCSTNNFTVDSNSIVTAFNKTGAGGIVYGYYNFGSPTGGTGTVSNNNFSNVTLTGATGFYGIRQYTSTTQIQNVTNNTVSSITGGSSATYGISHGYGASGSIVNGNNVNTISSSATIVVGIQLGDNIAGTVDCYRNKVYGISSSNTAPIVSGILIANGTNVSVYNNTIGDLTASSASGTDVIRGINIASTTTSSTNKIYFNTILLSGSGGTNFGTSGIFHTTSGTATTSALDMRNNIIINKCTPSGTGRTVAYRRSSTTLTNYATTSNNNLYFAGTPGANNLIFFDGTNSDQTLTAFITRMATRDAASQTEDVPFISTTGSNANFLRIAAGTTTSAESGGVATSSPAVTSDYWAVTRPFPSPANGGTTFDIGASEFDGIKPASITITPSSATICSGSSVSLTASSTTAYTYSWTPTTGLTPSTGATVSAAPTATTTYTVTGTLGTITKTATVTVTVNPTLSTVDITNTSTTTCPATVQTLTATGGSITAATATVSSGTVNLAIPDNSSTGVSQTLTVSGIPAGATITKVDVKYNITHTFEGDVEVNLEAPNGKIVNLMADQGSSGVNFTNTIATSNTSAAAFSTGTSPFTGTFKADLNPSSNLIAAINTQIFSDLFTTPNGDWKVRVYDDANLDTGTLVDCSITITYDVVNAIIWTQSPASPNTLFTDAACTTAYTSGNYATTLYAKPSATTTYTATATLGSCSVSDTVTYTVGTTTWAIVSPATTPSWDNGAPTSTMTAVISADYTSAGNLDACSLTVNNNAVVIISSGDDVTLSSGSLTVVSGSTYTQQNNANLMQTNASAANSGGTIIERNSSPVNRLDYTLWCSPVSGTQTLQNFSQYTVSNRFYEYNTATDQYNSISSAGTWAMAKGYLIRVNNTWPAFPATAVVWPGKFRGTPNNGSQSFALSTAGNKYNAVGNPYPSALKTDDFINDNSSNIEGTLWFWRKTNDDTNPTSYSTCTTVGCTLNNGHTYSDSDYISVGQGFLVQAKTGATAVNFTNSMRASTNINQFFKLNNVMDRYWVELKTASGISCNRNLYAYIPDATLGYDNGKDGLFIGDSQKALVSVVDNREMVIQARPTFDATDVIPLVFKTDEAGDYQITLNELEGVFAGSQDIYLRDNLLNITHNLKTAAYSFSTASGVFNSRFDLLYQPSLSTNQPSFDANNVMVIKQNDDIVINAGKYTIAEVKVYDMRGRILIHKKGINANEARLVSNKTKQVLLVQITSTEGSVVTKKIMN